MSYVDEDVNGVRSSHERSAPGDPKSVEQKEREKLAQSLHDDLTQLLVVARMKLHQHHRRSTEDTINAIDAILERCLMYTRSLMSDLLLPELEDGRLNDALHRLSDSMRECGLDMTIEVPEEPVIE